MFSWFIHNSGTILIGAVVLAAVTAIALYLIRKKRAGCSSCSSCPMCGSCHKK